ncbi:delta(14)-sterol reductase LBR isoform X2 [Bufo bufo]|uniref:delta(14)-sterol reductase LBR isoform X2 n=1 Tax=Bufo bufo TaxID=8384 RepID=UPI001ABE0935|nr:delta(14)-sterol reductase LBR isoform X2 [Bufo bufo]
MPGQRFSDGDAAMARWPGSNLYFEIQILSFDSSSQLYSVLFKDGTDMNIKESDIRSLHMFRPKKGSSSPSRRRSRSRSRSRSPARTPSHRRSPGRTPKTDPKSSPLVRDSRKGDILKVHLTPLKPKDFIVETRNGKDAITRHANPYRESPVIQAEEKLKVDEQQMKNLKVLRYVQRKEYFAESENKDVNKEFILKPEPTRHIVPIEKPVVEFGGAIGAALMMLSMPALLYYLLHMCAQKDASLGSFYPHWAFRDLWDSTVFGYFALWILLLELFYLLPIGTIAHGVPLATGKRLSYRINGLFALFFIGVLVAVLLYYKINLLYVYQHLHQFAASTTLLSVILSAYLFVRSRKASQEELSAAGKSRNLIYAFFMGRELNPRIGKFDLKHFSAVHAALISWVFINFIMLLAEMDIQQLESPSTSMISVNAFQLLYVLHALWNQESMLSSPDIAHEGFGFMLAFGNLVWVPFAYSLQAAYLVKHPVEISWAVLGAVVAMNTFGYIIFRSANNQKNAFRRNPEDPRLSYLKSIPSSCGSPLLVSGWWGFVRHPNYLGDIIMAWAWCLPCGFNDVLPYFYGFFLTGLLIHRVSRVEHQCRQKYSHDWDKYCHLVPYRILPYVY